MCQNCKKKQKSTKRFWIRRLPNVLCLHLKRFRWNNYLRTKLDTFVEFPLRGLDMSQYVLSNKVSRRSPTPVLTDEGRSTRRAAVHVAGRCTTWRL